MSNMARCICHTLRYLQVRYEKGGETHLVCVNLLLVRPQLLERLVKRAADVAFPVDQEANAAVDNNSIDDVSLLGFATIVLHF